MNADLFNRSSSKPVQTRWSSIAGVLLAGLTLGITSCNRTENTPAPETQEISAGDANAVVVAKDFGPTLLAIASEYSISHSDYSHLSASHYGFVDLNGKVVIEPQWDEASNPETQELGKVAGFSDGFAPVKRDGKWGWIDKTGRLFPSPFSSLPNFHEGLSAFERDGKWGYMYTKGTVVIQPEWEEAVEFAGGYAGVKRDGKWGGIDKTGRLVTPLGKYESLYFEPEIGLWRITVGGKSGYMDRAGRVVIKPQWDDVQFWSEGLAWALRERKGGFIDKTGKVVVSPEWEDFASPFHEGLTSAKRNGKWGFIDKTGKLVLELQWEAATGFHRGVAGVQRNGKWGFIDKTGKVIIEPRWDEVSDFHQELALVKENKKFGFIDRTGRVVIEPQWDTANSYWETQWGMSGPPDSEPYYWLVARDEKSEPDPVGSKPKVRVVWLDATGKQIWSSDSSNNSINKDASKSPPPSVSPAQDGPAARPPHQ
jgi:hypothetical protein